MLRIAIDINPILKEQLTGIGNYTLNLAKEILRLKSETEEIRFFYNKNSEQHLIHWGELGDIILRIGNKISYRYWREGEFDSLLRKGLNVITWMKFVGLNIDIFHGPSYYLPTLPRKVKMVVTIHDLAFMILPEIESLQNRKCLFELTREALQRADKVIAVSNTTKTDILKYFNIEAKKVAVIYEGVSEMVSPLIRTAHDNKRGIERGLPERFLLFVGTTNIRKNLLILIKALSRVKDDGLHLIIVGKKGNQHSEIEKEVQICGLERRVRFLGYCSTEELRILYQLCLAFVFPSLYEGFGLPVLEAMQAGAPVIVSATSSLVELFANSALLASPQDPDEWAECIRKLCEDNLLREQTKMAGEKLSSRFSWGKMGQETLDLYRSM